MTSKTLAVLGAQWGDEGKGKIVDLLCGSFDVVARFQGGHNAGHTVKFGDSHYSLHLIPSGILHPDKLCILGNGMVIDPEALLREIDELRSLGVVIEDNLRISDSAHVILPVHAALDLAREDAAGQAKIGTTGRGIGPAYESKSGRYGVVVADLLRPDRLAEKVRALCGEKNMLLTGLYGREGFDPDRIVERSLEHGRKIARWVADTRLLLHQQMVAGRRVMFEGAQGCFLDVDHGTYPFVTSSNCMVGGIATGLGVPPRSIESVMGVVKAYTTRVGEGPFPTELTDATGEHLRKRGNEFGTTTGRPRRTGWLDLVVLRTAVMINGLDSIALTKLDVLDELDEIQVCTGYRRGSETLRVFPSAGWIDNGCEPIYQSFPGWKTSIAGMRAESDLPDAARHYIAMIEEQVGCPISIISTGPKREETIER